MMQLYISSAVIALCLASGLNFIISHNRVYSLVYVGAIVVVFFFPNYDSLHINNHKRLALMLFCHPTVCRCWCYQDIK